MVKLHLIRGTIRRGRQLLTPAFSAGFSVLTHQQFFQRTRAAASCLFLYLPFAALGQSAGSANLPLPISPSPQSMTMKQVKRPTPDSANVLALKSAAALVVDQDTGEVLYEKNATSILPIASITKLMTCLVVLDASLDMEEVLTLNVEDRVGGGARSHLPPGTRLTRNEAMQLALMASENRAAYLLGRNYPGGISVFVDAMNAKAALLGMSDARFADPTGLSPQNQASAQDLVKLVEAAYEHTELRAYSTQAQFVHKVGSRSIRWVNTNRLTSRTDWDIGLQKTGYIAAAGRCLVMQTVIGGRKIVMILLDSVGRLSRIADAQRVRGWLEAREARRSGLTGGSSPSPSLDGHI